VAAKWVHSLVLLVTLLTANLCFAQAGAPTTVGAWYELNEAADIHSGDLGCYSPSQVNFSYHDATITMIKNSGAYTCGGNNGSNFSSKQDYLSGAIMWHDLNFKPTPGNPITIEVKAQLGGGWPSVWLLGGDKPANTGCQTTSPQSWDNFSTCFWDQDTMPNGDSAEIDIQENVGTPPFTQVGQNVHSNGNSSNNSSQTITDATQNFHVYHLDWSTSQICFAVDGVRSTCEGSQVPQQPMFLIIENRINSGSVYSGSFPVRMTIQYVQVCQGTTCLSPDSSAGNTLFLDDFDGNSVPQPATNLNITIQ
jgi:hypothetical protein